MKDAEAATSQSFAALPACEYWLEADVGEINVYGLNYLPPVWTEFGNYQVKLANFYDWLANQTGGSGQWNHPNYMTKTTYDSFGHYTVNRDNGMNIFEMVNQGSYDWQGTTNWESDYIIALDNGWHVMPAANSDTHATNWISGYDVRTVLLAQKLSPQNLYDAMKACRGYATQDKNLEISFAINGAVMGSTVALASTYVATIHISDPDKVSSDAITLVEIVSDGGQVVASMTGGSTTFDWTTSLPSSGGHYFYLRVSTASSITGGPGVTAWTAPIWMSA
jgi:hypothetical protein